MYNLEFIYFYVSKIMCMCCIHSFITVYYQELFIRLGEPQSFIIESLRVEYIQYNHSRCYNAIFPTNTAMAAEVTLSSGRQSNRHTLEM